MMFAFTVETWQAVTALTVIVAGWAFKFVQEFYKDRRDREGENNRLAVLRDIAASNAAIREGQIAQNGKLSLVVSVNDTHHAELVRAVKESCMATCGNFAQKKTQPL